MVYKIDFTEDDLNSEAREFTPIPNGTYTADIIAVEEKTVGNGGKNHGKPFMALTLQVAEGDYTNRRLWDNIMLFNTGANFSIVQLLRASGFEDELNAGVVPDLDEFMGKTVDVVVGQEINTQQSTPDQKVYRNTVKGYKPVDGGGSTKPATKKSPVKKTFAK